LKFYSVRPSRISGIGHGPMKGPLLGTNPVIDREEAKVTAGAVEEAAPRKDPHWGRRKPKWDE
jgi:hypothetical protein